MRKAGLLCAVVVRILASGAGGATVNRWSGNHAPAAEDLQREVVHLRNEVQVLRQTHAPAGALRPFAPPGDETILGVSIAKHNDAQTHRPLGRGFQRQKTLMPYLARARSPTGTVARTAEPNVASPGVVSSPASPIHTRLRREEGSQTIEEDSSGAVFAGEVELAILDNLASQARDRALRQISPRVFRCKNGKSKGEEAGQCEKREIAREHPAQCRPRTDEESQTEHEKTATEPLPVEGSLSPLQEASARTCRVPTDEPCLATALAKGRQNIILEASTHHQWTSTMELTHKVSILGNCGRTVALGSWELAAVLGGAMKNMDLRNEFGSSIAIVQGAWLFNRSSVRCAGSAPIRNDAIARFPKACPSTAIFLASNASVTLQQCTVGGISQRILASWGVFASARSRAKALGSSVQSCSEAAVAAVGEADVRLFDSSLQTSSVGASIDHSASLCMQGGQLRRNDFALEAGLAASREASLSMRDVLIRGDPKHVWRSASRPKVLAMEGVNFAAGPTRPRQSVFSFASQGAVELELEEEEAEEDAALPQLLRRAFTRA